VDHRLSTLSQQAHSSTRLRRINHGVRTVFLQNFQGLFPTQFALITANVIILTFAVRRF